MAVRLKCVLGQTDGQLKKYTVSVVLENSSTKANQAVYVTIRIRRC